MSVSCEHIDMQFRSSKNSVLRYTRRKKYNVCINHIASIGGSDEFLSSYLNSPSISGLLDQNLEARDIYDEYIRKTPLKGRLQFLTTKSTNVRHWDVVRRALIRTFRILTWKVRRVRNSGVTQNCIIIALPLWLRVLNFLVPTGLNL